MATLSNDVLMALLKLGVRMMMHASDFLLDKFEQKSSLVLWPMLLLF